MTNTPDPNNPMLETKTRTRTKTKVAMIAFFIAAAAIGLSAGAIRSFKFELPLTKPINLPPCILAGSSGRDLCAGNLYGGVGSNGYYFTLNFKNTGNEAVGYFSNQVYREQLPQETDDSLTTTRFNRKWRPLQAGLFNEVVPVGEWRSETFNYITPEVMPSEADEFIAVTDSLNAIAETTEDNNTSPIFDING